MQQICSRSEKKVIVDGTRAHTNVYRLALLGLNSIGCSESLHDVKLT